MRFVAVGVVAIFVAVAPHVALVRAEPSEPDPDTEIAKRYFDQGTEAYLREDYATAIDRFGAARRVKPLPAFDYNLGRCYDRSDQPDKAIEAYRRFLAASPSGEAADEARARLAMLTARVAPPPPVVVVAPAPPPQPEAPRHRFRAAWISLGVTGAVGVAALGTGLYTVVEHGSLKGGCGATPAGCSDAQLGSMRRAAIATDVLIGATAIAAVATIALFIVEARHRATPAVRAALERGVTF